MVNTELAKPPASMLTPAPVAQVHCCIVFTASSLDSFFFKSHHNTVTAAGVCARCGACCHNSFFSAARSFEESLASLGRVNSAHSSRPAEAVGRCRCVATGRCLAPRKLPCRLFTGTQPTRGSTFAQKTPRKTSASPSQSRSSCR